jgi:hypothetical protein
MRTGSDPWRIYAVGQDGADDGGKFAKRRQPNPGTDDVFLWWHPSSRRELSKAELPKDVFQRDCKKFEEAEPDQ